jgi:hypothetical protein
MVPHSNEPINNSPSRVLYALESEIDQCDQSGRSRHSIQLPSHRNGLVDIAEGLSAASSAPLLRSPSTADWKSSGGPPKLSKVERLSEAPEN